LKRDVALVRALLLLLLSLCRDGRPGRIQGRILRHGVQVVAWGHPHTRPPSRRMSKKRYDG